MRQHLPRPALLALIMASALACLASAPASAADRQPTPTQYSLQPVASGIAGLACRFYDSNDAGAAVVGCYGHPHAIASDDSFTPLRTTLGPDYYAVATIAGIGPDSTVTGTLRNRYGRLLPVRWDASGTPRLVTRPATLAGAYAALYASAPDRRGNAVLRVLRRGPSGLLTTTVYLEDARGNLTELGPTRTADVRTWQRLWHTSDGYVIANGAAPFGYRSFLRTPWGASGYVPCPITDTSPRWRTGSVCAVNAVSPSARLMLGTKRDSATGATRWVWFSRFTEPTPFAPPRGGWNGTPLQVNDAGDVLTTDGVIYHGTRPGGGTMLPMTSLTVPGLPYGAQLMPQGLDASGRVYATMQRGSWTQLVRLTPRS